MTEPNRKTDENIYDRTRREVRERDEQERERQRQFRELLKRKEQKDDSN